MVFLLVLSGAPHRALAHYIMMHSAPSVYYYEHDEFRFCTQERVEKPLYQQLTQLEFSWHKFKKFFSAKGWTPETEDFLIQISGDYTTSSETDNPIDAEERLFRIKYNERRFSSINEKLRHATKIISLWGKNIPLTEERVLKAVKYHDPYIVINNKHAPTSRHILDSKISYEKAQEEILKSWQPQERFYSRYVNHHLVALNHDKSYLLKNSGH